MQHLQKTRGGGILPILELIPIPHPAFFSTTYTLPISQALSFDIHPSNGVCVPPSIPSFIKQTPFVAGGKVEDVVANSSSCRGAAGCAPAWRNANHTRTCPVPKNYLAAAIEIAQEAGKILVEELSRPDIRASASRSHSPSAIRFSPPRSSIRFTTNFSPPRAAKAPCSTARKSTSPKTPRSRQACSAPAFPCATARPAQIFSFTATSPSTLTECAATGPPRWTSPASPLAASTPSGNSACRNGTPLPASC